MIISISGGPWACFPTYFVLSPCWLILEQTLYLTHYGSTLIYPEKTIIQKDTCTPMFIAALFTIARTWKQPKCPSTDEWIKKMWHIYTTEYYSAIKKEWNWVIYRDVDGSRDCHTEWSKSEREKQILYINAYMWNLEKWYRWTGLQGRNRDTAVENRHMDTNGGKWQGWWW